MSGVLNTLSSRLSLCSSMGALSFLAQRPNSILSSYKPILNDMLRSSSVLLTLPVSVGDSVSINTSSGTVASLSLSYVVLESKECTTYIPTHSLYNSVIKKYK
ncbi:hypothetical protein NECID01_0590 [Nematocida sp. AWRm77]|nr:hypothetical protein NECID01_0590 [Nematocida sp. AWRm77]